MNINLKIEEGEFQKILFKFISLIVLVDLMISKLVLQNYGYGFDTIIKTNLISKEARVHLLNTIIVADLLIFIISGFLILFIDRITKYINFKDYLNFALFLFVCISFDILRIEYFENNMYIFAGILAFYTYLSFLIYDDYKDSLANLNNKLVGKSGFIMISLWAIFASYYSLLLYVGHLAFRTASYDMGIFDNVFYNLSNFHGSYTTVENADQILQVHFSPIFYLLVPFYKLFGGGTIFLNEVHLLALTLPSLLLFKLSTEQTKNNLFSLAVGVSYLLIPSLHGVLNFSFHEISFFPITVLASLFFFEKRKVGFYYLFALLAMMTKEDVPFYFIMIGIYLCLIRQSYKTGLITIGISISYYILAINILPSSFVGRFELVIANGFEGISGILMTLVTNPWYVINAIFSNNEKVFYWMLLLAPVLFLPILSRQHMIIMIPASFVSLLTGFAPQYNINFQYSAVILPFIFYLTIIGAKSIQFQTNLTKIGFAMVLVSFYINSDFGSFRIQNKSEERGNNLNYIYEVLFMNKHPYINSVNQIISLVPEKAKVSASSHIVPHLSNRDSIYQFPEMGNPVESHQAEYIVYDSKHLSPWPGNRHSNKMAISEISSKENYGVLKEVDGVFLLKKNFQSKNDFKIKELYYQALSMSYLGNPKIYDNLSSTDTVIYFPQNSPNSIMFWGPYIPNLADGKYVAKFSLRGSNSGGDKVAAVIDVFAGGVISQREVKASELNPNTYTSIELEFTLPTVAYGIETRLFYRTGEALYCEYVSIKKL